MNTFATYSALIDWETVGTRIAENPGRLLDAFELEDAKELVWLAGERWLARDLEELRIEGVEEEFTLPRMPDARTDFHGFVDLRATLTGVGKPYNGENPRKRNFEGLTLIADWKTTEGGLDWAWKDRLKQSWQWKLYAFGYDAAVFSYRGLSRSKKETEELLLEVPESNGVEVREYLRGAFVQRQAYVDAGLVVWPRRRPMSCKPFGRDCPFDDECHEYSMPKVAPGDRQLSYSSIGDILMCPEYHRRKSLTQEREETDSTIFGSAVHRGLEELYRQAKGLQGNA